jgi:hypothetical protein
VKAERRILGLLFPRDRDIVDVGQDDEFVNCKFVLFPFQAVQPARRNLK